RAGDVLGAVDAAYVDVGAGEDAPPGVRHRARGGEGRDLHARAVQQRCGAAVVADAQELWDDGGLVARCRADARAQGLHDVVAGRGERAGEQGAVVGDRQAAAGRRRAAGEHAVVDRHRVVGDADAAARGGAAGGAVAPDGLVAGDRDVSDDGDLLVELDRTS